MTGEDLFGGQTRTVATDASAFEEEHTRRSVAAEEEQEEDYSVRIQRGADAEETVETALVPFRPEDVTDDWTEHKLLPGETRRQMVAQVRPTNAAGAIGGGEGKTDAAALMEVTAPVQRAVVAAAAPTPTPTSTPTPTPTKTPTPTPTPTPTSTPTATVEGTPDANVWDGDAPTRACIELPEVADKGAVFEPPAHGARPDEATRMYDSAIALQRAPEWTLDARQMYRELRTRARNAWATRRRLCILAISVAVALAFTTGAVLWPTRAKPLTATTRAQPRKPPSLHPAPGGDAPTTPQELDLLVAKAVVAYDTGRRVESAEMFHRLTEVQPDEQAWQFMSDILDRTNAGGAP